jgi:Methyltransferase domain
MSIKRKVKDFSKNILRDGFELFQKANIDILPHHFYSEIPNIAQLRQDDFWQQPRTMTGIIGKEIEPQVEFVRDCCQDLVDTLAKHDVYEHACAENGEMGFGFVEANFLYCFIRRHHPPRIVQVGCGVSTAVILLASKDAGYQPEITCVDPFPTEFLQQAAAKGEISLVSERAQKVRLDILTALDERDLLFVDSTHTVKPGSEVNRLILEVLPLLKPGVFVHFHDIYFPYDYKRGILNKELFFSNESVLLQAFLTGNSKYKIVASLSMIYYADQQTIARYIPNFKPAIGHLGLEVKGEEGHFPSSTYLQVIG